LPAASVFSWPLDGLGDADVEHLTRPSRASMHVVGLEVAVEDALAVGGGERVDAAAWRWRKERSSSRPLRGE
jgi:hypothetical protein